MQNIHDRSLFRRYDTKFNHSFQSSKKYLKKLEQDLHAEQPSLNNEPRIFYLNYPFFHAVIWNSLFKFYLLKFSNYVDVWQTNILCQQLSSTRSRKSPSNSNGSIGIDSAQKSISQRRPVKSLFSPLKGRKWISKSRKGYGWSGLLE